ncbi:bax inhibitor family protein [Ephemerocybe angulata]|uniref:Bax inhibitor family protein n=1 Tax=Ephemerocybe angulata TaxID=980116 RepID=A0A8H6HXV2_9AGAR|nr:bax inhibitor family protein [Tulosesus angulatus]
MQRLPFTTFRSLLSTTTRTSNAIRPASRSFAHSKPLATTRSYGSAPTPQKAGVLDALRNQKMKSGLSTGALLRGSRTFMTDRPIIQETQGFSWQRMAWTAAGVAGAVIAVDAVFNRDTREALSPAEREYLNSSFKYTGAGIALTALAARAMFKSGVTFRIMFANPWAVLGVSLVGSIGTMMGVFYTPPEKTFQKHAFWLAFNACQAATLSPLFFFAPAILSRAALYTVGVVGSLSYIGATATNDRYLYLGGPLLAGVTVVALSSLAPMILPMGIRGLVISESISLYGGLAVFGGFVLYDTQKILKHAQLAERGLMKPDPINESIGLELDMINIFIRLVTILSRQNERRK